MKGSRFILGIVGIVSAVAGMLATPAHAAPVDPDSEVGVLVNVCDDKMTSNGNVNVYYNTGCNSSPICWTPSWDSDYGNSNGPCQGSDTNRASSVLNTGYAGSLEDVEFYNGIGTDWGGGRFCLQHHAYIADLSNVRFSSGVSANDSISSHRWVNAC